jgi:hypothetical protein
MAASKINEAAIFLYQRHIYETKGLGSLSMNHFYNGHLFRSECPIFAAFP